MADDLLVVGLKKLARSTVLIRPNMLATLVGPLFRDPESNAIFYLSKPLDFNPKAMKIFKYFNRDFSYF